jgi:transposase
MDSSCDLDGIDVPKSLPVTAKGGVQVNDTLVGVDLAKAIFQLAISRRPGHFDGHPRLTRDQFLPFFAQLPAAIVIMEACGTCHYWARKLRELGHAVVLLPPGQVRPFVRRNKTDRADAKALVDAYRNGEIRPVPVKTPEQQVLTSLHRLREGWMAQRTARLNALRGLLREQGVFIRVGANEVVPAVWALIEDADSELAMPLRALFAEACQEIREIERRLDLVERELGALARQLPAVERLMQIPGIGLIIATALVGFVGDLRRFPSARHFASYLGLTPREYSSGLRQRLGRISKRGDSYLRMLLVHGARSVLSRARTVSNPDRLRTWALALEKRAHHNKATVALANKIARIAWAVSVRDTDYRSVPAPEKVA